MLGTTVSPTQKLLKKNITFSFDIGAFIDSLLESGPSVEKINDVKLLEHLGKLNPEGLKTVLSKQNTNNDNLLMLALKNNYLKMNSLNLSVPKDLWPTLLTQTNKQGQTLLHMAVGTDYFATYLDKFETLETKFKALITGEHRVLIDALQNAKALSTLVDTFGSNSLFETINQNPHLLQCFLTSKADSLPLLLLRFNETQLKTLFSLKPTPDSSSNFIDLIIQYNPKLFISSLTAEKFIAILTLITNKLFEIAKTTPTIFGLVLQKASELSKKNELLRIEHNGKTIVEACLENPECFKIYLQTIPEANLINTLCNGEDAAQWLLTKTLSHPDTLKATIVHLTSAGKPLTEDKIKILIQFACCGETPEFKSAAFLVSQLKQPSLALSLTINGRSSLSTWLTQQPEDIRSVFYPLFYDVKDIQNFMSQMIKSMGMFSGFSTKKNQLEVLKNGIAKSSDVNKTFKSFIDVLCQSRNSGVGFFNSSASTPSSASAAISVLNKGDLLSCFLKHSLGLKLDEEVGYETLRGVSSTSTATSSSITQSKAS